MATNRPPERDSGQPQHSDQSPLLTASSPVSAMEDRATATSHSHTKNIKLDTRENRDPCRLGTPVCLPAVVWYEDTGGLLVVNLTWRGRNYIGTLADTSIQKPR